MKRIIIGVIACICAITAMAQAQTHDVKGVVFDRRQQPIVGALVTAQGTNISTITDVDGKFLLQEVPLSVKKVIVTSIGMETREVDLNVPVQLTGKRKKLSFVAHAGLGMSKFTAYGSDFKVGYEFGLGIEVRMSKRWAFQPTLQIRNHGAEFNAERTGDLEPDVTGYADVVYPPLSDSPQDEPGAFAGPCSLVWPFGESENQRDRQTR